MACTTVTRIFFIESSKAEEYASQFLNANRWAHNMCPLPWQCKHLTGSVSKCPCRACAHHQAPTHPVPIKCAYAPTVASVLVSSCALARRYRACPHRPSLPPPPPPPPPKPSSSSSHNPVYLSIYLSIYIYIFICVGNDGNKLLLL